jgi:hypothetical protein
MGEVHSRRLIVCAALTTILVGSADPVAAQQPPPLDVAMTAVYGIVVDDVTHEPIEGALVRLLGTGTFALTDAYGVFQLPLVEAGPQLVSFRQYGYGDETVALSLPLSSGSYLDVSLVPGPIALDGIIVVADRLAILEGRLRGRRNAAAVTVQTIAAERLARSAQVDVLAMLRSEAALTPIPCAAAGVMGGTCLVRRGGTSIPMVCIDDRMAVGGLDELAGYATRDLHLVEVYSAGAEIRAYSRSYIQALIRRPRVLLPAGGFGC